MNEKSTTIPFHDYGDNQEGFAIIRRFDDKVAICLSLKNDGDVEALIERKVITKLIEALRDAIS